MREADIRVGDNILLYTHTLLHTLSYPHITTTLNREVFSRLL